jgi:Spy/CpxP family protein refolding chaperone
MSEINEPVVPSEENNQGDQTTQVQVKNKHNKGSRKKFVIGGFLVLFIIAGVIGVGFAKNRADKFRDHGPRGFMIGRIVKDLDLSEQQKKEVEAIKEEIRVKMQEKRKNRQDNMSQYEDMFRSSTFDKQKALELTGKRDAEREEMKNFMIEQTAKVHAILTPDQRNKAADKMKEMRERKGRHKDGRKHDDGSQKK